MERQELEKRRNQFVIDFAELHGKGLRRFIVSILLRVQPADIDDLMNDVLFGVSRWFETRSGLQLGEEPSLSEAKTYACGIAYNRRQKFLQARYIERHLFVQLDDSTPLTDRRCSESEIDEKEQLDAALSKLSQLREPYRTTFLLAHQEEFSYKDIATIMCCDLGTVKSRLHRAKVELREIFADDMPQRMRSDIHEQRDTITDLADE